MKVCPRCNKQKSEEEFGYRQQKNKAVLKSYCKQCEKEYREEYNKTHKRKYQYNKWEGVEKK